MSSASSLKANVVKSTHDSLLNGEMYCCTCKCLLYHAAFICACSVLDCEGLTDHEHCVYTVNFLHCVCIGWYPFAQTFPALLAVIAPTRNCHCRCCSNVSNMYSLSSHAGEGDLRLVDDGKIFNWVFGNLQVFFEGSWSQVCSFNFTAADAEVACRQLGQGSGTVMREGLLSNDDLSSIDVFPEAAIVGSFCDGHESRLIDCGAALDPTLFPGGPRVRNGYCQETRSPGLVLACVTSPQTGVDAGVKDQTISTLPQTYSRDHNTPTDSRAL